jgi:hypothetical protein
MDTITGIMTAGTQPILAGEVDGDRAGATGAIGANGYSEG